MKIMKKPFNLIFTLILFLMSATVIGCSRSENSSNSPDVVATQQIQEIVESVSECDTSGLCELFCAKVAESCDLDSQVSAFMSEFATQIVSFETAEGFPGEKKIESGTVTLQQLLGVIWNVEVTSGEIFTLRSYAYSVHPDSASIGVYYISATGSRGTCFEIGNPI